MEAGKLRARVELQTNATSEDALGGQGSSWTTTATCWGELRPQAGAGTGELLTADMLRAGLAVVIVIRYRSGVTSKMRAKLGSRIFEIGSVVNVGERNKELQLVCSEVLA